jgi:hypothetical protein
MPELAMPHLGLPADPARFRERDAHRSGPAGRYARNSRTAESDIPGAAISAKDPASFLDLAHISGQ